MIVVVGIVFAFFILAIIIWMLLSHRLREKYAILWLTIGVTMLVLTLFPDLLFWLSEVLGVQIPTNLLFVAALALLIGVTLHQSWELSTAEDETRRVAEEIAILRADVEALRNQRADSEDGVEP
ncbi:MULTISPECIES: DUF2304 domain-containing protein [Microbacterium]|uniref:DUF2304 domain-containing protein n=1 Tax=Microbacterium maritypicum TaxID=33918 RepID=A0A4Y4B7W4_MICMQ|nr:MULTISPECIES: DUF2304 domain-containing protein [Microbacterium]QYG10546.1 DUF2304 domain-containing protein [Microbacterium sp. PAMC22086]GEC75552.1 hypothetical protein MLI01_16970 [Microbacterium liquefaciens]GGV56873.1 hypothetical protein GCM10010213_17750 [Microbacterium liquefaciens]